VHTDNNAPLRPVHPLCKSTSRRHCQYGRVSQAKAPATLALPAATDSSGSLSSLQAAPPINGRAYLHACTACGVSATIPGAYLVVPAMTSHISPSIVILTPGRWRCIQRQLDSDAQLANQGRLIAHVCPCTFIAASHSKRPLDHYTSARRLQSPKVESLQTPAKVLTATVCMCLQARRKLLEALQKAFKEEPLIKRRVGTNFVVHALENSSGQKVLAGKAVHLGQVGHLSWQHCYLTHRQRPTAWAASR
jgi:hypothetical protein